MIRRWMSSVKTGTATAVELIRGLWQGPFWWMVPIVLLLLPAAVLFVFLQAVPFVAPFVYTVF
ncbi:MAG: hypothetical protein ACI9F9_001417 [Candidatus Paceibacteria bacterium]|jgi:hypothetical protein